MAKSTDFQSIHEEIFDFLQNWSNKSRTSESEETNPYFYMRNQRDERFKKGYWFPGNEDYLAISFWAGGDSQNMTPNVYFEIHKKNGVRVIIVAKDSVEKRTYFEGLVSKINKNTTPQYKSVYKGKMWIKHLDSDYLNYSRCLYDFITQDKVLIDNYLNQNKGEFEDFVSKFDFITPANFDKMLSKILEQKEQEKAANDKRTEDLSQHHDYSEDALPLALRTIEIEKFQGIISAKIESLPTNAHWIYITGENGYGKTTLLQAIALGFDTQLKLNLYIEPKTKITLATNAKEHSVIIRSSGSSTVDDALLSKKIVGYGPSRLNVQAESSENAENKNGIGTLGLFDSTFLLKNINYELFASGKTDSKSFDELGKIINVATKGRIGKIDIQGRDILFSERLKNGEFVTPLPLSRLAAGFRNTINIICDIYLRLKEANKGHKFSDFEGVVLIDEIETHLHPSLQKELSEALTQIFPKIQFIATTHSPIPLLGAPRNCVILHVNRVTVEEGVKIERLDEEIEFQNLLPNAILTSPIFGFKELIPNAKDDADFIRVENTYDEVVKNDKQQEKVDAFLTEDKYSKLLQLLKN